jgi:hypothetical protein
MKMYMQIIGGIKEISTLNIEMKYNSSIKNMNCNENTY